jgi:hypothetical protein
LYLLALAVRDDGGVDAGDVLLDYGGGNTHFLLTQKSCCGGAPKVLQVLDLQHGSRKEPQKSLPTSSRAATELLLERASATRAISNFMIAARGCILHDGHTSAACEWPLCACENSGTATFMTTGRLQPKMLVMIISHPAPTWRREADATSCRAQACKVPLEKGAARVLTDYYKI